VRERLTRNMASGVSPRAAALDIVGRYDAGTKKRVGGVLGLDSGRQATVDRALERLRSGDPEELRAYLRLKLRDRRFDNIVLRAIRDGKSVSAEDARKMVVRYQDRLLRQRGETIARTELHQSLHNASFEGVQQIIDSGKLKAEQVSLTWDSAEDGDTRQTHRDANGQAIVWGQRFSVGGYPMRYPGDRANAPAHECINCRCRMDIDFNFLADL